MFLENQKKNIFLSQHKNKINYKIKNILFLLYFREDVINYKSTNKDNYKKWEATNQIGNILDKKIIFS